VKFCIGLNLVGVSLDIGDRTYNHSATMTAVEASLNKQRPYLDDREPDDKYAQA
jgi:hypothetical protein